MKIIALLTIGLLTAATAQAAEIPPSLFLTADEQRLQAGLSRTLTTLDALVYYGQDQWRLWLNGQLFTPETPAGDITITAVTPDSVSLRQQLGNKNRSFILSPHQSFDWNADRVLADPILMPPSAAAPDLPMTMAK